MKRSQRIFKNVAAGAFGTVIGGALQFAAILMVARKLGPATFGLYSFLATLAFVLNRLADLGTSAILVRDLAVRPEKTRDLLSSALSLAWCVIAVASLLIALCVHVIPSAAHVQTVTILMAMSGLLQFPCACYAAVMRAREDNELESLAFFLHKVFLFVFLWIALTWNYGLEAVAGVHLLCAVLQWAICRWIVVRRYVEPYWRINVSDWAYILRESTPFGVASAARLLGEQADVTVLAWMAGLSAVGLYSGVYRITMGLRFVSQAMIIGVFPVYSRAAARFIDAPLAGDSEFRRVYALGIRVFTLLGLPLATAFLMTGKPLVGILLGPDYLPAVGALRILAIAAGIFFIATPFPYVLTALNENRTLLVGSVAATTLRTALLVGLSALYGITGASWAVLISESALLAVWTALLAKKRLTLAFDTIWKGLVACAVMGLVLYVGRPQTAAALASTLVLSTAAYGAVLLMLKTFSPAELRLAAEAFRFIRPLMREWARRSEPGPDAPSQRRDDDRLLARGLR